MHQTNHRGHNETSTATTQNQLAYKACADGAKYRHARMPLNILGYHTLTNMRQLTRHNLGYRLNPFPYSVISNLALVACRSSVFDVRGRACSGCPVRHSSSAQCCSS